MKKLLAVAVLLLTAITGLSQGVRLQAFTTNSGPTVTNIVLSLSSNLQPNRLRGTNALTGAVRIWAATSGTNGFWLDPATITPGAATNVAWPVRGSNTVLTTNGFEVTINATTDTNVVNTLASNIIGGSFISAANGTGYNTSLTNLLATTNSAGLEPALLVNGNSTFWGNVIVEGTGFISAQLIGGGAFTGVGTGLSGLQADNISGGTLHPARMATNTPFAGAFLKSTSPSTAAWSKDGSTLTNITGNAGGATNLLNASGEVVIYGNSMEMRDPNTGWTNVNWSDQTLSTQNTNVLDWFNQRLIGPWTIDSISAGNGAGLTNFTGRTLFVATNGNDSTALVNNAANPWRSPYVASLAAKEGDTIFILPGIYNVSNSIAVPKHGALKGNGTNSVLVGYHSLLYGTFILLSDFCEVSSLSILDGYKGNDTIYVAPIGASQANTNNPTFPAHPTVTRATMRNLFIDGGTDGIFFRTTNNVVADVIDCVVTSKWDCVTLFSGPKVVNLIRSQFYATSPNYITVPDSSFIDYANCISIATDWSFGGVIKIFAMDSVFAAQSQATNQGYIVRNTLTSSLWEAQFDSCIFHSSGEVAFLLPNNNVTFFNCNTNGPIYSDEEVGIVAANIEYREGSGFTNLTTGITKNLFTTNTYPAYSTNRGGVAYLWTNAPNSYVVRWTTNNAGTGVLKRPQGGTEANSAPYWGNVNLTAASEVSGVLPTENIDWFDLAIENQLIAANATSDDVIGSPLSVSGANIANSGRYIGDANGLTNIQEAALNYWGTNPPAGYYLASTSSNTPVWFPTSSITGGGGGGPFSGGFTNGAGEVTASGHTNTLIGDWTVTNGTFTVVGSGAGEVIINDAAGGEAITLTVPTAVLSNYSITLPSTNGADGNVLMLSGGNLAWITPGDGSGTGIQTNAGSGIGNTFSNAALHHAYFDSAGVFGAGTPPLITMRVTASGAQPLLLITNASGENRFQIDSGGGAIGHGGGFTNILEQALVTPPSNPDAGLVLISTSSNTATWGRMPYLTNAASTSVIALRNDVSLITTNNNLVFTGVSGVVGSEYHFQQVMVTNSSGSTVSLAIPAHWQTPDGLRTYYVTNASRSKFLVEVYGAVMTNFTYVPLW